VWTTAITVFEIAFGIELLVPSHRRKRLEAAFARVLEEELEARILSFDPGAGRDGARLAAGRQSVGKPVDFRDIEIAGIVSSRRATLATGNTSHFRDLGIDWVDPWTQKSSASSL